MSRLNGPMAASELVVNAVELMRVPGTRRIVDRTVALADLDIDDSRLSGDVAVHVVLESSIDDLDARGELAVSWSDECRRCLRPLADELRVAVDERYAEPDEQRPVDASDLDTFPVVGGRIDLRPMVREGLLARPPGRCHCAGTTAPACARRAASTSRPARATATRSSATTAGRSSISCASRRRAGRPPVAFDRRIPSRRARWPFPRRRSRSPRAAAGAPVPGSSTLRRAACAHAAVRPSSPTSCARPAGGTRVASPSK